MNKVAGYLYGKLSVVGFYNQMIAVTEVVTHDVIASSEIEGEPNINDINGDCCIWIVTFKLCPAQ